MHSIKYTSKTRTIAHPDTHAGFGDVCRKPFDGEGIKPCRLRTCDEPGILFVKVIEISHSTPTLQNPLTFISYQRSVSIIFSERKLFDFVEEVLCLSRIVWQSPFLFPSRTRFLLFVNAQRTRQLCVKRRTSRKTRDKAHGRCCVVNYQTNSANYEFTISYEAHSLMALVLNKISINMTHFNVIMQKLN